MADNAENASSAAPSNYEQQHTTPQQQDADAIIQSGKLVYDKREVVAKLSTQELFLIPVAKRTTAAAVVSLSDVYGVQMVGPSGEKTASRGKHGKQPLFQFYLYLLPATRRQVSHTTRAGVTHSFTSVQRKKRARMTLGAFSLEECERWVAALRRQIEGPMHGKKRRVLVLVNPFGGTKKAPSIYRKVVQPMFAAANLDHDVVATERQHHATDIAAELDLDKYTAVITISGDGLLHEVVTGLMRRDDWRRAIKTNVGIIPGGSGNGLAASIGCEQQEAAVFTVIKGHTGPLTLMRVRQEGEADIFAHLAFFYGILSDIDIESEKFRWMGGARMQVVAVQRLLALRKYNIRLWYLPSCNVSSENNTDNAGDDQQGLPPIRYELPKNPEQHGWKRFEDLSVGVMATNVSHIASDTCFHHYASPFDPDLDLMFVTREATLGSLLKVFLDQEGGGHFGVEPCKYVKVRAFVFEPLEDRGIVDVDGEMLPMKKTSVESMPHTASLFCPIDAPVPLWKPTDLPPLGINLPQETLTERIAEV